MVINISSGIRHGSVAKVLGRRWDWGWSNYTMGISAGSCAEIRAEIFAVNGAANASTASSFTAPRGLPNVSPTANGSTPRKNRFSPNKMEYWGAIR
jgi:hypothetical protein